MYSLRNVFLFVSIVGSIFLLQDAFVFAQQRVPNFLDLFSIANPQDAAILSGGCAGNPYAELKKLQPQCDTGQIFCTPQPGNVSKGGEGGGLNPEFACRLVNYFKRHPDQKIVSAYRSIAHQARICGSGGKGCAPPGTSCHQYGLAVDVSNIKLQVKQVELGLIRAYSGPHLQCQENSVASCGPNTKPCSGRFPNGSQLPPDQGQQNQGDAPPADSGQSQPAAAPQQQNQTGAADVPYKSEPVQVGSLGETVQAPTTVAEKNGYKASCADDPTCTNAQKAAAIKERSIPDPFTPTHVTTEQVPKKKSSGAVQQAELNGGIRYIVPTYSDIPRTNNI
jgi:hypothetical protein